MSTSGNRLKSSGATSSLHLEGTALAKDLAVRETFAEVHMLALDDGSKLGMVQTP